MPSQVGQPRLLPTNRRTFLQGCLAASSFALLSLPGCVSRDQGELPELVWGRRGLGPGRFLKPRAITIDDLDQLYIVDTTGRIQVFDADGNLLRFWRTPETANGRPTGLAFEDSNREANQSKASAGDPQVDRATHSGRGHALLSHVVVYRSGRTARGGTDRWNRRASAG